MQTRANKKIKITADLFRKVIPKMSQLDIPLTPQNYHIWYEYTSGSNQELNETIDDLLKSGKKFTSRVNKELYKKHIYQIHEEGIKTYQQDIRKLVDLLLEKISGMTKTTQNFSASLNKYQKILDDNPDIESVASLITDLIDNVGSVLETNESMGSLLEYMNEEVDSLRSNMQVLNFKAYTDQLTNIPNRRAFDTQLDEMLDSYHEEGQIFSLLFIDIDHFKKFNDQYGHDVGDRVLKYVANVLVGGIKGDDMLARFGGEEFAVFLPHTSYDDAFAVANFLRKKVASSRLVDKQGDDHMKQLGYVTVSIGVAHVNDKDDIESIVKRVDNALYMAKEKGRDVVVGEFDL